MNERKSKELEKALMDERGWGIAQVSGYGVKIGPGRAINRARRALGDDISSESSRSKDQRRRAGQTDPRQKELFPEKKAVWEGRRKHGKVLKWAVQIDGPKPRSAIDRIRKPKARHQSFYSGRCGVSPQKGEPGISGIAGSPGAGEGLPPKKDK